MKYNVPFYYLPGGHIEFKESANNALIREIEEETGHIYGRWCCQR